jgi:hypothetical protein
MTYYLTANETDGTRIATGDGRYSFRIVKGTPQLRFIIDALEELGYSRDA